MPHPRFGTDIGPRQGSKGGWSNGAPTGRKIFSARFFPGLRRFSSKKVWGFFCPAVYASGRVTGGWNFEISPMEIWQQGRFSTVVLATAP